MRCPAGRSVRTVRPVKSDGSISPGPRTRLALANASVVAYSTNMRDGRSARVQTIARPTPTSPAVTPKGAVGRAPGAAMIAGACAVAGAALKGCAGSVQVHRENFSPGAWVTLFA